MIQKLKQFVVITMASLSLMAPVLVPVAIGTASADIKGSLCQGINNAASGDNSQGCGTAGQGGTVDLSSIAQKIVNIFSVVVGIVAVIMIIYGGFRYITSGGESGRVGSAKNTLIYAIIGLIVVALAQIIVHFVINTASNSTSAT